MTSPSRDDAIRIAAEALTADAWLGHPNELEHEDLELIAATVFKAWQAAGIIPTPGGVPEWMEPIGFVLDPASHHLHHGEQPKAFATYTVYRLKEADSGNRE